MNHIIINLQWINIFIILTETWFVFKNMKNRMHYYLFLNCVFTLLYSIGYMMTLFCKTEEAFYKCFYLSWGGKLCIVISTLIFCVKLCKYKMPKLLIVFEAVFPLITYVVLLTNDMTGLFYRNYYLEEDNGLLIFQYEQGTWYIMWNLMVLIIILTCFIMVVKSILGEKIKQKKRQYISLIIALAVEIVIGMFASLPIGRYYDFNQLGFALCAIIIIHGIFRNNLLDAESMAKEYIVDELSAGVIALNTSGNVEYYNKKAFQIFPEIENDAPSVIEQIKNSIKTGEPITVNDTIYTFEERNLVHKSSLENKMYVLTDATVHYQHMRELKREKQIADEANRAKSEFLASMSHEIRTPINAVLGMDEMILRESTEDNVKEYAMDIQAAGRTLLTIINDILDLNKIESGKMEIVPVEYDIAEMLYDITNMIDIMAKEKGLEFKVSISSDITSRLWGDDVRIRQVLMNLLTNAVKYTQKGSVCFRVSLKSQAKNEQDEEVVLHFEVEDTGIGIKAEDMDKVFAEFERIELVRNRNIEGTGLGMPITIKLLSFMDSKLQLESEYGKGSLFAFDLKQKVVKNIPIGDFNNVNKIISEHSNYADGLGDLEGHILMVDDNDMNRKVFFALLKDTKMKITQASSGYEAIELASKQHFDIIFMDHMMPGMDGVEAMKKIKATKDGPCADTPIVVLTANAVSGAKEKYIEDGFDGFLSKPIVYNELEILIKNMIIEE